MDIVLALIIASGLILVVFGLIINLKKLLKYRKNIIFVNLDYHSDITYHFTNIDEWLEIIELTEKELEIILEKCSEKLNKTIFIKKVFNIDDIKEKFGCNFMNFNIKKEFILIGEVNKNKPVFYNLKTEKIVIVHNNQLYLEFFDIDYYSIIQKDEYCDK